MNWGTEKIGPLTGIYKHYGLVIYGMADCLIAKITISNVQSPKKKFEKIESEKNGIFPWWNLTPTEKIGEHVSGTEKLD